jgi:tetratricopeptide (TPR) repeat protein
MSKKHPLQQLLDRARNEEKEYRWLQAIPFYHDARDTLSSNHDYAFAGEMAERIGYCHYQAAMQAEVPNEFTTRMEKAVEAYEEAYGFYEKVDKCQKVARQLRCRALAKFSSHWLRSSPSEKRELLEECWRLTKDALTTFEGSEDNEGYWETFCKVSSVAYHTYRFQWDSQTSGKILREAIDCGERAISLLSTSHAPSRIDLARVYAKTVAYLGIVIKNFSSNIDEYERYLKKAQGYWVKGYGYAADAALLELLAIPTTSVHYFLFEIDAILVYYKEALEYAKTTRDKYLIGAALNTLGFANTWKSMEIEDPDESLEVTQSALHYAKAAQQQFSAISVISPLLTTWPEAPYTEHNWWLAQYETDVEKKRYLLNEAIREGTHALELAASSGIPELIWGVHHPLSKVLESLARITSRREKRELLEKALEHRKETLRLQEQLFTSNYWNSGVMWNYLANIKAELADLETSHQNKIDLFREAISDKEKGIRLCLIDERRYEKLGMPGHRAMLGRYQYVYGELLDRLNRLRDDNELQRRAIQAFDEAAITFLKLDMISHAAECYWKVGRLYGDLREHLKAAEQFTLASTHYTRAIKRVPPLEKFYQSYASYMDAWSEIEQGKHHHEAKRYEQAQHHYEKAATLHQTTKWNYLSPNYSAWARLEAAEHLSRSERPEEAKHSFHDAAQLFLDAKRSIEAEQRNIEDATEKALSDRLLRASDIRRTYCLGRIALEEARLLDRRGEHLASSVKYSSATETFQDVADAAETDRERHEITPIIELSKAWQLMTQAEAEVSPDLYAQASQQFERVKEHTTDERARVLAVGHSLFCKALAAGTRFEATRDQATYAEATKYVGAAETYFVKAGYHTTSAYARATHRLLDAYWYLYQAETEMAPGKKSQYYQLSAKLLQTSTESYARASHPEKTEQVQRLLDRVLEEQQLTTALTEVLHSPVTALTTESFVTPMQTYEHAVGVERFAHAHIQGKLTIPEDGAVGDAIECRLDLVNVGKTLGLLIRIDDLFPKDWILLDVPSPFTLVEGSLNLQGRALGPLKSEAIILSVQARTPGAFTLSPRVIYVDEAGTFQSSTPEPVTLHVQPQSTFEFRTNAAQKTFHFLLQAFIEDYMRTRLSLDTSGWRTLMAIVKATRIPRSSVYGARGRSGHALAELERRGLVETRIFPGERGRGGRIRRVRIAYDKEPIQRHIDQHVMKNRKNLEGDTTQ